MKTIFAILFSSLLLMTAQALAQDASDLNTEGKIQAAEIFDIQTMVAAIEGYKAEGASLQSQGRLGQAADLAKLANHAEILTKSISDNIQDTELDSIFTQISQIKLQACAINHDVSTCN